VNEIIIRPAELSPEGDLHFILSSWLKTYRESGKFTRRIKPQTFYQYHEERIKRLFDWPLAEVTIACTPQEPTVILGYRVSEEKDHVLHWLFVRPEFQKMGIAKKLLEGFPLGECHFTHWTINCDEKINRLLEENPRMNYNPYLF